MANTRADTSWPYRLLHVASLTSFIRKEGNSYNGVVEPEYNIISYTWGRFQNPGGPSLTIRGIDWPVPAVRPDHFTVDQFHGVIQEVGQGVEFIWVDIACIPQYYKHESAHASRLRGEEIGRQILIFRRATQAFVWLCKKDFVFLSDCTRQLDENKAALDTYVSPSSASGLISWLVGLEDKLNVQRNLVDVVLADPWFSSLWTLQEAVLRRDAYITSREGQFHYEVPDIPLPTKKLILVASEERDDLGPKFHLEEQDVQEDDEFEPVPVKWSLTRLAIACITCMTALETRVNNDKKAALRTAADMDVKIPGLSTASLSSRITELHLEIKRVQRVQYQRGLTYAGEDLNPNVAYSASQFREVSNYLDRIYGITQIYGITCSPSPPGNTDKERLQSLTTEFGRKLIESSPLLSQLFIHSTPFEQPRSWMITPECEVPWFMSGYRHEIGGQSTSSCKMELLQDGQHVRFVGRCCNLSKVLDSNKLEDIQRWGFHIYFVPDLYARNAHLDWQFQSTSPSLGEWRVPKAESDEMLVLLLGFFTRYSHDPPPPRQYYGLVLASGLEKSQEARYGCDPTWKRVGVVYWMAYEDRFDAHLQLRESTGIIR